MSRPSFLAVAAALTVGACTGEHAQARTDSAVSSSMVRATASDTMRPDGAPEASVAQLCARPARGIVIGTDSLAGLPAHATLEGISPGAWRKR